jgi:phosphatidate cytidylyltransferase
MTALQKRLIFGSALIAFALIVAWADGALSSGAARDAGPWRHGGLVTAVWLVLTIMTLVELMQLLAAAGLPPIRWLAIAATIALVLIPWWTARRDGLLVTGSDDLRITLLVVVGVVTISGVWSVYRGVIDGALGRLAGTLFAVCYVGLLMSFAVRLRVHFAGPAGPACVLFYIMITKMTDVGAYFVGSAIGRVPLIPTLSPKKTVEGLVGGVLFAILVGYVFHAVYLGGVLSEAGATPPSALQVLAFSAVIALLGQLGDLVESVLKRSAASKDSGDLVPGFGGIFDVTDSLVLTAPVAWWLLTSLPAIR